MKESFRNISFLPFLRSEGHLTNPLPTPPPVQEGVLWYTSLRPHERLYYHHTLSSVRYCRRFVPTRRIPRDSLEFILQSRYDHSREQFPEKVDTVIQRETCIPRANANAKGTNAPATRTFRVLRNIQTVDVPDPPRMGHPLHIGGLKEKVSPHSVKIINSSIHTQLVNNGFSRQSADGNFFRY